MLKDTTVMNPKGRVKLEMYNEDGVFFTKEKKNLVVTSANEIIANMISNPAKTSRLTQLDKGETGQSINDNKEYVFRLSLKPQSLKKALLDVISVNTEVMFDVQGMENVTKLVSVKSGDKTLEVDKDVFLKDAQLGKVEFAVAPTEQVEFKFQTIENEQVKIIAGTEIVKVAGEEWKRGKTPNTESKTYAFNHETGEVYFEHTTSDIEVSYDCEKHYGLGFMGIGGKPAGHLDHQPVSFSQMDKDLTDMDGEFHDARQPIIYPSVVEQGKPELEVLPTKLPAFDEGSATILAEDDDLDEVVDKVYRINTSGKKLLEIVSAKKLAAAPEDDDVDLVIGTDIAIKNAEDATIELTETPEAGDLFEIVYRVRKNDLHLRYELAVAPVVKLVNVFFESASGSSSPVALDIQNNGMQIGVGEVWMMNANQGVMQISSEVEDLVSQPGQLTVEYQVNSGTIVKFVADFPRGVPGPAKVERTDNFVSSGNTTFILDRTVAKDEKGEFEVLSVLRNGVDENYTVHPDGARIDIDNVSTGDNVVIKYRFMKEEHEIYQVAMFDEKNPAISKMFNISGIGPVTKDKNTGMRITWSVTF